MSAPATGNTALHAGGGKVLSLVVVDSGLGGLSICAGLVEGLRRQCPAPHVAITYFNAWPEQNRGYNSLPNTAERLRVFDRALEGMLAFKPDIVYMACNTLSILYPETRFSRQARVPVIGIVPFGVDLIRRHLLADPRSRVIILGTLTTIASGAHRDALTAGGIDGQRIVNQACDQLATEIEKDPRSRRVQDMIDAFIGQAAAGFAHGNAHVFAALCCTHYGYALGGFERSLKAHIGPRTSVLNPNDAMNTHFFEAFNGPSGQGARIEVQVVSRILWNDLKVAAIASAVRAVSPLTAQALVNYRHDPNLFCF